MTNIVFTAYKSSRKHMIQFLNTEDDIDKTHCAKSIIFFFGSCSVINRIKTGEFLKDAEIDPNLCEIKIFFSDA